MDEQIAPPAAQVAAQAGFGDIVAEWTAPNRSFRGASGCRGQVARATTQGAEQIEGDPPTTGNCLEDGEVEPDGSDDVFVYVIGPSAGPQKVGISASPSRRLYMLQTGNPRQLCVHETFRISREEVRAVERHTHRLLDAAALRGEWFNITPKGAARAVKRAIKEVRFGPPSRMSKWKLGASCEQILVTATPSLKSTLKDIAARDGRTTPKYASIIVEAFVAYVVAREEQDVPLIEHLDRLGLR